MATFGEVLDAVRSGFIAAREMSQSKEGPINGPYLHYVSGIQVLVNRWFDEYYPTEGEHAGRWISVRSLGGSDERAGGLVTEDLYATDWVIFDQATSCMLKAAWAEQIDIRLIDLPAPFCALPPDEDDDQ